MSKLDKLRAQTGGNVAESMGRGVASAPLTHGASPPVAVDRWTGVERLTGAQRIAVNRIVRDPAQPRETFPAAELSELAESIRARGILQPIRVRWNEGAGVYVIVAGERRFRASQLAGLAEIPCVVTDAPATESEILLDQLAENLIRLDLEPIEQAKAFRRLMDLNDWSARRLAEALSIDHDKVNRAVRLLELPDAVQEAVAVGELAPATAYEVSKLDDPAEQAEVAALAVSGGLNRADVVQVVRQISGKSSKGRGAKGKPRKTSATMRTPNGVKITLEHRKGLDSATIRAALQHALATLGDDQAEAA